MPDTYQHVVYYPDGYNPYDYVADITIGTDDDWRAALDLARADDLAWLRGYVHDDPVATARVNALDAKLAAILDQHR